MFKNSIYRNFKRKLTLITTKKIDLDSLHRNGLSVTLGAYIMMLIIIPSLTYVDIHGLILMLKQLSLPDVLPDVAAQGDLKEIVLSDNVSNWPKPNGYWERMFFNQYRLPNNIAFQQPIGGHVLDSLWISQNLTVPLQKIGDLPIESHPIESRLSTINEGGLYRDYFLPTFKDWESFRVDGQRPFRILNDEPVNDIITQSHQEVEIPKLSWSDLKPCRPNLKQVYSSVMSTFNDAYKYILSPDDYKLRQAEMLDKKKMKLLVEQYHALEQAWSNNTNTPEKNPVANSNSMAWLSLRAWSEELAREAK